MKSEEQLFTYPDMNLAIEQSPLIISPDLLLIDAIALIEKVSDNSSKLGQEPSLENQLQDNYCFTCALVVEDGILQGILTERDIVKLTAEQLPFKSVYVGDVMTESVISMPRDRLVDVFSALFLFRRYRIRHLPIVDRNKKLLGIVTPASIRRLIRPEYFLKMRCIADVMTNSVVNAPPTSTVLEVAQLMASKSVSCVVLTKKDEKKDILLPVGIITERDILKLQLLQIELDNLTAEEAMSTPIFLMSPQDSLFAASQEMKRRRIHRLVVASNSGKELGIVTQTSILRVFDPIEMYRIIEAMQATIKQLEEEKVNLLRLVDNLKQDKF